MRNVILVMAALLLPLAATAKKPPELASAIKAEAPIGSGTLKKLFMHVYDASYWSDSEQPLTPPYALSITYAMDFTAEELAERTFDEMGRVSNLSAAQRRDYANRLKKIWPNVKEGDRITALAPDATRTEFFHNGKAVGSIDDAAFQQAFFGVWLSPKTSEPAIRAQLFQGFKK